MGQTVVVVVVVVVPAALPACSRLYRVSTFIVTFVVLFRRLLVGHAALLFFFRLQYAATELKFSYR